MAGRVIVVLPTETYRAADFVEAARRLDVELAIASELPLPLLPSGRQVTIDCADPATSAERIADLATDTPVDAIVAADDAGAEAAARASELLGLPTNPVISVQATLDKRAMRQLLRTAEVAQPDWAPAATLDEAAAVAERLGYPVVTKPRTRSASVGVMRSDSAAELAEAFDVAVHHQQSDDGTTDILIERYVEGPEISVEGIVSDGHLEILAVFDKPDQPDGPTFEETMFVAPSSVDEATLVDVERTVAAAVRGLGLTNGPVHAELRLPAGRPTIIEVAARTIGGICGRSLSFGLMSETLEMIVLRGALGRRSRGGGRRIGRGTGVMMIPIPRRGVLTSVDGVDAARAVEGVTGIELTIPIGSEVVPPPDGDRYLGFIFAVGTDRDAVIERLRNAHSRITLVIR